MSDLSLPPGLTLEAGPLPMIRVSTPAVEAAVTLQGAQLVGWQPAGAEPVLYLSRQSRWQSGAAIRGGIPVCFPWFGGGRDHLATAAGHAEAGLEPAHGWARVSDWQLFETSVAADGTASLTFELWGADLVDKPHSEHFPADARVRYTMHIGAELLQEFEVISGFSLLDVETLLHTYLAVDDITQVTITGLDGAPYWDKVTGRAARQVGDLVIDGEVDRVHDSSAPARVVGPGRTIEITTTGAGSTVVWNPGAENARGMADFGDQDFRRMVCVESGNVSTAAITVGPGESHVMTVHYRLV